MTFVLITTIVDGKLGKTSRHDFDNLPDAMEFANNHKGLDCIAVVRRGKKVHCVI